MEPTFLTDASDLLKPGVFVLSLGDRVVYVGIAKRLLDALGNHSLRNRRFQPAWFPVKPIHFNRIEILPCDPSRARLIQQALIALHDPFHNRAPTPKPSHPAFPAAAPGADPSPIAIRRL